MYFIYDIIIPVSLIARRIKININAKIFHDYWAKK